MEWRDVAVVLGPVLAYLAARTTTKQSDRASRLSKRAQDNATEVDRERLGLTALESSLAEQERRIGRLRADLNDEKRLRQNEAEANATWKRAATGYIHDLRDDLRAAQVAVRQPPEGLELS